jgi:molybdopterin molybdotransferase
MADYPIGLTVEEGLRLLLAHSHPVSTETVPIWQGNGRILAEDVMARESMPPFDRSPLDGYAIRACDTVQASKENPVTLRIIEEVPAGHTPSKCLQAGEATKILTGAPIPEGADVVVKYEETKFDETSVTINQAYRSGTNIVKAGEEVMAGDVVVEKGTKISPAIVGLLSGLGTQEIPVYRKPVAAIISTGEELEDICTPHLQPGKIRNSSMYALQAFLQQNGVDTVLCGIATDKADVIAERIQEAVTKADVVITTGGVSVGDYDMLQRAVKLLDAKVLYWKTKMKPGSAFLASVYQDKLILSLSGNPGAAAVALLVLGVPVFRKMGGYEDYQLERIQVKLPDGFGKKSKNRRFIPGKLQIIEGQPCLQMQDKQGNGMLNPLANCNVLGDIPLGSSEIAPGSMIEAFLL